VEFSEIPGNEKITQYDPNAFAKHELTERFITSMADLYMEQSEPVNVLFKRIRAKLEREVTRRVLDSYKWDKKLAAKKMGVSRKTIDNMVKKYDLDKRKAKISVRNTKVSGSNRTI
jgi:DNA-binding NtrC family response regulator